MEDLPVSNGSNHNRIVLLAGLAVLLIFAAYFFLFSAPVDFPGGAILSVDPGVNLRILSSKLKEAHIIRSRSLFEAFVIMYGGERRMKPGDYLFEGRLPVFEIARRISFGDRHLVPIKITIPEGFTISTFKILFPQNSRILIRKSLRPRLAAGRGIFFRILISFLQPMTARKASI